MGKIRLFTDALIVRTAYWVVRTAKIDTQFRIFRRRKYRITQITRIHFDRTSCCYRYYRHFDGDPDAGIESRQGAGQAYGLPWQSQADGTCLDYVRIRIMGAGVNTLVSWRGSTRLIPMIWTSRYKGSKTAPCGLISRISKSTSVRLGSASRMAYHSR